MDFKGGRWISDAYQKFEAMCLEVEETMYQDAVKFVESQVQNVGSNMKKFYTDVVQDLVAPCSTDSRKQSVTELPLNSYADTKINKNDKPSSNDHTETANKLSAKDVKVIECGDGDQVPFDELNNINFAVTSYSSGASKGSYLIGNKSEGQYEHTAVCCKKVPKKDYCQCHTYMNTTPKDQVSENWDGSAMVSEILQEHAADGRINKGTSEASGQVVGWQWDDSDFSEDDYSADGQKLANVWLPKSISERMAEDSRETSSLIESCVNGNSEISQSTGDQAFLLDTGRLSNCDADIIDTNDTTYLQKKTTIEDHINLEETCVLVDGNNPPFVSLKESKPWSYKKKVKEAFSLKKKSSRRRQYEKLATQYGDSTTSSGPTITDPVARTLHPNSNTSELQKDELCESEWELL